MKRRPFNLLKPIQPPKTVWDKVYDWLLGRARIVLLITEILIAASFFAKVIQDTDAKNKEDEIVRLTTQLDFYKDTLEPSFRVLENKDNAYRLIWNNSPKYSDIVKQVYEFIGNTSSHVNLRVEGKEITIFGTEDLSVLQRLEAALKSSDIFSSVVIRSLTLEQQEILEQKGDYILSAVIKDLYRDDFN
jgi:hypothetical protein